MTANTPAAAPPRFCRIALPNATLATRAFDFSTQTNLPISDISPDHFFLTLPAIACTAILHEHGKILAVAQCPLETAAALHLPPHIPTHLPATIFVWSMPTTTSHPSMLTTTHGSLARIALLREPLALLPGLHSILLRACHMLDACYAALATLPARSLAFQCLALSLHNHCDTNTPPTAAAVVRCIYEVARSWSALVALLPDNLAAGATALFAMPAVLEHAPRPSLVQMAGGGDLRTVVVLRTRKVLEIIDIERKCLIVPSAAAAEVAQCLCTACTDVQVLSFADARARYAKVWWYGARACAERLPGGGFALGLPLYTALAHAPVMVENRASLLARKPKFPLLLAEELVLSEYAVLTGGCAQNFEAARWVLSEAAVRDRAVIMDLHGLDQPVLRRVPESESGAPRRLLWSLCITRALRKSPAVAVRNQLVANVHRSIAHKLVELAQKLGADEDVETVREGCAVLVEMVQLSTGGEVRRVLEDGLGKVGRALAEGDDKAVGSVHEEMVHLVVFMFQYW